MFREQSMVISNLPVEDSIKAKSNLVGMHSFTTDSHNYWEKDFSRPPMKPRIAHDTNQEFDIYMVQICNPLISNFDKTWLVSISLPACEKGDDAQSRMNDADDPDGQVALQNIDEP